MREGRDQMQKISDDEAWLVLLIIILQQDSSRVAKLWSDFESEIKYNNRFFQIPRY